MITPQNKELLGKIIQKAKESVPVQASPYLVMYSKEMLDNLEEVKKKVDDHKAAALSHAQAVVKNHELFTHHLNKIQSLHENYAQELERIRQLQKGEKGDSIKGDKGERGEDGISPSVEEIVSKVIPLIPVPKDGKDGEILKPDTKEMAKEVISYIRDNQLLDLSHIKGAQKFIKDGVSYRFEELMHGGGKTGVVGLNPQTPVGTINSVNRTFTCTGIVTVAFVDGSPDSSAVISGTTNSTIVYSVPPQEYVFAF